MIHDSIEEKPSGDENQIVCWHFDNSKQTTVKGINFLGCLSQTKEISSPIGFTLVRKTRKCLIRKTEEKNGRGSISKNEVAARWRNKHALRNKIKLALCYLASDFSVVRI